MRVENRYRFIWLMLFAIIFCYANGEKQYWMQQASARMDISHMPKVGEVFTLTYTYTPFRDPASAVYPKEMKFAPRPQQVSDFYEIVVGQLTNKFPDIQENKPIEFTISLRITKPVPKVRLHGYIPGYNAWHSVIELFLLDSITGQYGTGEQFLKTYIPIVYRYDACDGSFTEPCFNALLAERNSEIIAMMKQLEPRLSDSLALLLHSDQYRVGAPPGLSRWDEENEQWIMNEVFEYYLNDSWYDAAREGKHEEWIQQEREKIIQEHEKENH
jgi:hypothetical protein